MSPSAEPSPARIPPARILSGQVPAEREAGGRRALFSDSRGGGLRATWHPERGVVVVSLWHGNVCAATVRLDSADTARLAAFLMAHGGERDA